MLDSFIPATDLLAHLNTFLHNVNIKLLSNQIEIKKKLTLFSSTQHQHPYSFPGYIYVCKYVL